MLYASTYWQVDKGVFLSSFFDGDHKINIDDAYFDEVYNGVLKKEKYLIYVLKKYASKFDVTNMHIEYVLPIFIWSYEMLYIKEDIPERVSINEAIELSKKFCDDSARKLVNWVLNSLITHLPEIKEELKNTKITKDFSFFLKK